MYFAFLSWLSVYQCMFASFGWLIIIQSLRSVSPLDMWGIHLVTLIACSRLSLIMTVDGDKNFKFLNTLANTKAADIK